MRMAVAKVLSIVLCFLDELLLNLPSPLRAYYLSLKFLLRLAFDNYSGVSETKATLATSPPIPVKVFRPTGRPVTRSPTYVVLHGLSVSGFDDPRVLQLAKSVSGTGAIAVVPHLDGLASCTISPARVLEIASTVDAIAADASLCPTGRVATISACITAGFVLVASTRTRAIRNALCIGSHASARHVLAHCLATRGRGDARYAVEAALLSAYARDDAELQTVFRASLADDHLRRRDRLPAAIERLPRAASEYSRVMGGFEETGRALRKVYEEDRALWEEVSPLLCARSIGCRSVTLIHSKSDCIVPPHECRLLFEALRKENPKVRSRMKITSLLDHADKQQFGVAALPELFMLAKAIAHFFLHSNE